jgi:hypothetical protein
MIVGVGRSRYLGSLGKATSHLGRKLIRVEVISTPAVVLAIDYNALSSSLSDVGESHYMGKVFVSPMTVTTAQYIRKPLYVGAVRLTDDNFEEIADWCQGEIRLEDSESLLNNPRKYIHVRVHNPKNARQTKAFVGDWLLYTERGYKVYTDKAFLASFDEVGNESSSYPYNDNGTIVLGPECFVQRDGAVLSWKGINYIPQTTREDIFVGSEEVMPGVTVSQAVEAVRSNGDVKQNGEVILPKEHTEKAV